MHEWRQVWDCALYTYELRTTTTTTTRVRTVHENRGSRRLYSSGDTYVYVLLQRALHTQEGDESQVHARVRRTVKVVGCLSSEYSGTDAPSRARVVVVRAYVQYSCTVRVFPWMHAHAQQASSGTGISNSFALLLCLAVS